MPDHRAQHEFTYSFQNAAGTDASVDDLIKACHNSKRTVLLYAPETAVYVNLTAMKARPLDRF